MASLTVLDDYKTLLANSATFRTLSGAANVSAALDRIFIENDESGIPVRTDGQQLDNGYGVIKSRGQESEAVAGGTKNFFMQSGAVTLTIVDPIAEGNRSDTGAAKRVFLAKLQGIKNELEAIAGSSGFVSASSMDVTTEVWRNPEEEIPQKGDYMWGDLASTWGP